VIVLCPMSSCTVSKSTPPITRRPAKVCRSVCRVTPSISACSRAVANYLRRNGSPGTAVLPVRILRQRASRQVRRDAVYDYSTLTECCIRIAIERNTSNITIVSDNGYSVNHP
jgi:hypothetical protein